MITGSKDGWRFLDTGINNAFLNMAIDEAMLDAHLNGFIPPTLRVYRWNPGALSLGYFQNMERDVNQGKCSELGIDVVRRLSGGRAVLHHEELTYSIVASEKYGIPKFVEPFYKLLSKALIEAYGILGMEVCLVPSERGLSSAACFTSVGSADLSFQGRKIAGSAQYRKGDTILQHGSLPITFDLDLFSSILKFPSTGVRDKVLTAFNQKVTSIGEVMGRKVGWQELKEALFMGFQQAFSIKLYEDTLTRDEIDISQKLAEEKYGTFDWTYYGRCESERQQSAITAVT